ncbi:DUF3313 domain-containing protein [Phenylobacterium sp. J426]|uniref:DUF3313 domain-containing protein n=1 Tax=Phenylobacterium sp. J426 TaxID=2898439 RepID=UPI002151D92E|nr:DUF3313 domain-containing protein [Phenylobacterium sp. J426]MCR5875788.1 DUF3313 domain-containing protein [Phenylobacterium sp. J426]
MKPILALPLALALVACATPHRPSDFLTSYEGLEAREGTVRADIRERRDDAALAGVRRVVLAPTILMPDAKAKLGWLSESEQTLLLREVDAQLCFEASERYELVKENADASLRAAVTRVGATNAAGSLASAAAGFFIPGPIGLRVPGSTGGLGAEAELLARDGRQLAAITWNRNATPIGTDNPSLSRVGDALQFAEPFADDAVKALSASDARSGEIPKPDPCAEYGPRIRPEGWLTKFATGLYIPETSAAKPAKDESKEP